MPLPSVSLYGARQCVATCRRSGEQCRNPAAFGGPTCRYHGARRPESIPRGARHWNFKDGFETLEARQLRSSKLAELRYLESCLSRLKLLEGPRWRGRKPSGNGSVDDK